MVIHKFIRRAGLSSLLFFIAGCGVVSSLTQPQETPTAVPKAIFEVVASNNLNPDINGVPKPILVRLYELRSTTAFDRSGFLDLQDKDETQLGGDFVKREEFLISPGESFIVERQGNQDVRAFAVFAAYRDLERSTWRAAIDAPNSVEMRRRWWGLGSTERLQPVKYLVTVSSDAVKIQIQQKTR